MLNEAILFHITQTHHLAPQGHACLKMKNTIMIFSLIQMGHILGGQREVSAMKYAHCALESTITIYYSNTKMNAENEN